jgi:hypothetical protein
MARHVPDRRTWTCCRSVFRTRPFSGERRPAREEAKRALADDGIIATIVERFDRSIGLWADDPEAQ